MILFILIVSVLTLYLGALLGRADGSDLLGLSEWSERSLIMSFFVAACSVFAGWWGLLAYLGVVGIATGHGQYFLNMATKYMGKTKERVDPLVEFFFGTDPRDNEAFKDMKQGNAAIISAIDLYGKSKLYWRNVTGMFVTGTLVGLPACILSYTLGEFLIGSLFLLTGVSKALSYIISDYVWKSTEPAEYINGGLRSLLCLMVIILVLT